MLSVGGPSSLNLRFRVYTGSRVCVCLGSLRQPFFSEEGPELARSKP